MKTRYEVYLDGIPMSSISPSIYILDIREKEPKLTITTAARPLGGVKLLHNARSTLSVAVRFAIREYDTARRRDICAALRSWAHWGYLSTSDRPNQRMYAICDRLPTVASALQWVDTLELTFTAYDVPYFEAEYPTRARIDTAAATGSVSLLPPGDAEECLVDAHFTATTALSTLTIDTGKSTIALTGLAMAAGDVLHITHDPAGILSMKVGKTSVLAKRTAESDDDLIAVPGKKNTITFSATGSCKAVFESRGRYL